ncbi:Helix-turn-helix domain-containing protein [Streptomyces sp. SolWspMP-5a-2]|nr:Helix-turn-helix domain-containing protein [Streptomyces sp. SolWspMP-5a-2]
MMWSRGSKGDGVTAESDWGGAPPVLRMILGRQLEALRVRAGLSYDEAGAALGVSHSTIRRMEAAKVARLRLADAEKLLRTYGITDPEQIERFLRSVQDAGRRSWWHSYRDVMPDWFASYLSLEQAAWQIRSYENHFVHDLLQTAEYARSRITSEATVADADRADRLLALRLRRQRLLSDDSAPRLWVVMDETVLRWPVGGADVMRAQAGHLIELNRLPHVTLQIMPFTNGPHPGLRAGASQLFRFRARELPDIVYARTLLGADMLDKRDDVMKYREALDRLSAQAAPAARTEKILEELRRDW